MLFWGKSMVHRNNSNVMLLLSVHRCVRDKTFFCNFWQKYADYQGKNDTF